MIGDNLLRQCLLTIPICCASIQKTDATLILLAHNLTLITFLLKLEYMTYKDPCIYQSLNQIWELKEHFLETQLILATSQFSDHSLHLPFNGQWVHNFSKNTTWFLIKLLRPNLVGITFRSVLVLDLLAKKISLTNMIHPTTQLIHLNLKKKIVLTLLTDIQMFTHNQSTQMYHQLQPQWFQKNHFHP